MKLISGPMATLSHAAFRIIIEQFGHCDEYYTEMINAPSLLHKGPFEKFYIDPAPVPSKIVWQLTGKESSSMIKASEVVGRLPCLGVDINMGCSAPEIYNSGAGIAWMIKDRSLTEALVKGVKGQLNRLEEEDGRHRRLSVKCRLGDTDFKDDDFYSFIDMLVSCGIEQITLHPRTRKEKYRDKPRYEYAENLALRYDIPVIVNGDVKDKVSLEKVASLCPHCKGVMIARAVASKPWIFKELRGESFEVDRLQVALDFIEALKIYQPEEFYKTRLQRFFSYYCMTLSFSHYATTQLINSSSLEDAVVRLHDYFGKVPEDRILKVNL